MKMYFYEQGTGPNLRIAQVSVEYSDKVDCHILKIDIGDTQEILEVFPEEQEELYDGRLSENLRFRIRSAITEMSKQL